MAGNSDSAIETVLATSRTARCHNAFFRQQELKFLHDTLRTSTSAIIAAIIQDTSVTDAEATTEVAVSLSIVKEHYASIDTKKELEEEYRTAKGKDAGGRSEPWGVAYIEPDLGHTPFVSVVSPLSAAIAAGNCVALKLENNLRALPSLLRSLLPQALESDTFQIIASSPTEDDLASCISVLQSTTVQHPTYSQLFSGQHKVIAVVDRTANLAAAAENLVAARFAFGGTSPYAPDLVLVNEFAKREFLEQVLKHAMRYLAASSSIPNGTPSLSKSSPMSSRGAETLGRLSESKHWKLSTITKGDTGAIVELISTSNTHVPLPSKLNAPVLCISAISSLDHAIDLVASDSDDRLTAAYHFAAPAHTKYLSQFVKAEVSFVNHVPKSLLLGPAAPLFHEVDIAKRYTKEHFVRRAPVLTASKRTGTLVGPEGAKEANKLLEEAIKEIKVKKRAEWIAIGFFEQGILIGLGVYGVPLLTCIGASVWFGVRAGLRKWAVL